MDEVDRIVHLFLRTYHVSTPRSRWGEGQDLVQDVFERAFLPRSRAAFDGERPYGPFLGRLTRNLLIDWARKRGREIPVAEIDCLAEEGCPPANPTSEGDPETMAVVEGYVSGLATELRRVHEARYVLALTQEDACDRLGLTRQQLRTLEKRLRTGLQRELKRSELRQHAPRLSTARVAPARND